MDAYARIVWGLAAAGLVIAGGILLGVVPSDKDQLYRSNQRIVGVALLGLASAVAVYAWCAPATIVVKAAPVPAYAEMPLSMSAPRYLPMFGGDVRASAP